MPKLRETDLVLNPDGSVYHLNLLPEDVADTIITVGDPDRVAAVSKYFDRLELKKGKREFITHTGYIGTKRLSVISTGIGTDNIDIVLNELDALANIDLESRTIKNQLRSLDIIRIGTSGAVQEDVALDSVLVSSLAIGLDTLMLYYKPASDAVMADLTLKLREHFEGLSPYASRYAEALHQRITFDLSTGITLTAPGFYAAQGRHTRAKQLQPDLLAKITAFRYQGLPITNLEMETAGIYGLASVLGHQALSVNAILASRLNFTFSRRPQQVIDKAIQLVLERLQ